MPLDKAKLRGERAPRAFAIYAKNCAKAEPAPMTFSVTLKSMLDQVEWTALRLTSEACLPFLDNVLALLSDARIELIDSTEGSASTTGEHHVVFARFAGLDELCAAALLAGGTEAP